MENEPDFKTNGQIDSRKIIGEGVSSFRLEYGGVYLQSVSMQCTNTGSSNMLTSF